MAVGLGYHVGELIIVRDRLGDDLTWCKYASGLASAVIPAADIAPVIPAIIPAIVAVPPAASTPVTVSAASRATAFAPSTPATSTSNLLTIDCVVLALAVVEFKLELAFVALLHAPLAVSEVICMAEDVITTVIGRNEAKTLVVPTFHRSRRHGCC